MKINTNLLHNLMLSNIHKSAALALVSRMAYAQTAAFDPNEFFDEAYLERLLAANGGEGLVGDNGDSGLGGGFGGGDSGFGGGDSGFGGGDSGFGGSDFDIDDPNAGNGGGGSGFGGGLVGSGSSEVIHPVDDTYMGKFSFK
jgi:hypothetical protein